MQHKQSEGSHGVPQTPTNFAVNIVYPIMITITPHMPGVFAIPSSFLIARMRQIQLDNVDPQFSSQYKMAADFAPVLADLLGG